MADNRLPREDEDFNAFIRRLHPKPKDQMTRAEHADWYADCVDWVGYFGFRDAAKGKEGRALDIEALLLMLPDEVHQPWAWSRENRGEDQDDR